MRITVCQAGDVELLDRSMPTPGIESHHARRYERQLAGAGTFLLAWRQDHPVGHCEVRWDGCAAAEVRAAVPDCPEINGLAVWPVELRSRGIGTALIGRAESLAARRGLAYIGLGVGHDNPRAEALYARLGYRPVVDYHDRWSYRGTDGPVQVTDPCTFLVKGLRPEPDSAPAAHRAC